MDKDNKNTELNDTDKKLHISDVITRYIHEFVDELKINENLVMENLKVGYSPRYGKITVTETIKGRVRWFDKYIYNEL
jgi:predicted RNA-binding protein with RPS1 domain